jgi:hypothetical protein
MHRTHLPGHEPTGATIRAPASPPERLATLTEDLVDRGAVLVADGDVAHDPALVRPFRAMDRLIRSLSYRDPLNPGGTFASAEDT